jgi:hypothetical protein
MISGLSFYFILLLETYCLIFTKSKKLMGKDESEWLSLAILSFFPMKQMKHSMYSRCNKNTRCYKQNQTSI